MLLEVVVVAVVVVSNFEPKKKLSTGQADSPWILPFTAGGFVYIATTSVLPSLLEGESLDVKQSIFEFLAIVLGIVLMLIVGLFE